ncbi:cilia- and flagella-associated protein 276 isoform X2 [Dicentrarchus labrax]|uniref:cilia- and flagella-associated protein 276 isoform X2 n=1 Tax=Dicentrarchus labrax TaxID=13489 RepID=UPI001635A37C|nr:cilia- and flagella-associated protein 276 isoform X2 [Dicentrarchus labrax]
MSGRDPFPFPKLENGFTLSGFRPQQQRRYDTPTHIAQTEEPWSRLHDTATLASTRRSVMHYERQSPNDSLDFQLKSVYDHHKDFFWTKNEVLYQKETLSEDQRKKDNSKQDLLEKEQEKDIRVWVDPQKCSIYSIK